MDFLNLLCFSKVKYSGLVSEHSGIYVICTILCNKITQKK